MKFNELEKLVEEVVRLEARKKMRSRLPGDAQTGAYFNAGNIAEGIYTAALAAAFWRAPQEVTMQDLDEVLEDLLQPASPDSWLVLTGTPDASSVETSRRQTLTANYEFSRSRDLCSKPMPAPTSDFPPPRKVKKSPTDKVQLAIGLDTKDLQWLLYLHEVESLSQAKPDDELGKPPKKSIKDWKKMRSQFQNLKKATVDIVNQPHVIKYTHYFSCDGYANTILCKAAGVDNQAGGATDVYVAVIQDDGQGGKTENILSDDLQESLKTFDTDQLAQVGQTWSKAATIAAENEKRAKKGGEALTPEEEAQIDRGIEDFFTDLFGITPSDIIKNDYLEAVALSKTAPLDKKRIILRDAVNAIYFDVVEQMANLFDSGSDRKIIHWLRTFFTEKLPKAIDAPTITKLQAGSVEAGETAKYFKRLRTADIVKWAEDPRTFGGKEGLEEKIEIDLLPSPKSGNPMIEMKWEDQVFFRVRPKIEKKGRVSHYFDVPKGAFFDMINDFLKGQEEVEKVKEHLTRAHGSYNMLTEMIENLMSEE
jgi:hypothetical protein